MLFIIVYCLFPIHLLSVEHTGSLLFLCSQRGKLIRWKCHQQMLPVSFSVIFSVAANCIFRPCQRINSSWSNSHYCVHMVTVIIFRLCQCINSSCTHVFTWWLIIFRPCSHSVSTLEESSLFCIETQVIRKVYEVWRQLSQMTSGSI